MAERDDTTRGTTTGARPAGDPYETDYRDPRTTPATATTTKRGRSKSWIGVIVAVLVIVVIAAWWTGGFYGGEEAAMLPAEPVVEGELLEEGVAASDAAGEDAAVVVDEVEVVEPAVAE